MNKNQKHHESILPGVGVRVVSTKRHPKGDIEFALKKLKKEIKSSGKLAKLREQRYFVPKKDIQRDQKSRARYFQQQESKELRNS
jgi:ribosomal protein S21|tara:strand:+ start:100 stop:354 length:255 start_codon:yes stop_codon:yes gene_type:complete